VLDAGLLAVPNVSSIIQDLMSGSRVYFSIMIKGDVLCEIG
jgi:hypothetical protein